MRIFASIVLPSPVRAGLDASMEPRRGSDPALSLTHADQWHVTLAFAGAASARSVDVICEGWAEWFAATPAFDVTLAGAGAFPTVPSARVLWVGVRSARDELERLCALTRTAMRRDGADVEGGDFVGHVTLGRWRRPVDATRWLRVVDALDPIRWRVGDVALLQSHLHQGPHGRSRYEALATASLV